MKYGIIKENGFSRHADNPSTSLRNNMKLKYLSILCIAGAALLTSCSAKKDITYFQNLEAGQEVTLPISHQIKLEPGDKLSIVVTTGDPRLNALFNLHNPRVEAKTDQSLNESVTSSTEDRVSIYTLDSTGAIQFPLLGKLNLSGRTREQTAEYIRRELISRDLAKNPTVSVEFLNQGVTVLGEVSRAGRVDLVREDFTILDALAACGDLTIYGERENVKVLREENGLEKVYVINLTDGRSVLNSPVYYLQPKDIIYVEPNSTKARTATPNGNSMLTPSFWISIASFLMTTAVLVTSKI